MSHAKTQRPKDKGNGSIDLKKTWRLCALSEAGVSQNLFKRTRNVIIVLRIWICFLVGYLFELIVRESFCIDRVFDPVRKYPSELIVSLIIVLIRRPESSIFNLSQD